MRKPSPNRLMARAALVLATVFFSACANIARMETPVYAVRIEKIELPLLALQNLAVANLPAGLASASSNGREFTSKIFIQEKGTFKPAGEAVDRFWARIKVLGGQRPYAIEVYVTREKRVLVGDDHTYEVVGHDMRLAKELANRIREQLSKRREDLNIIDDFRVF